jgi:hypothetical protein
MKRSEIVEKLVNEGMSPTTLVKFTDKQLTNLAERMLGEALTTTLDAVKKSPALQAAAKDPNQSIKLVGEEDMEEELKGDQHKIDKNKNGKIDAEDFKLLKKEKKSEMNEWVSALAEENFHSFTSKNEIMELINFKLNESETHEFGENVKTGHNGLPEFMTYDAISDNGPKIAPSKPKVDPGTKPSKPRTPFQPGPGVNPKPKALKEDKVFVKKSKSKS